MRTISIFQCDQYLHRCNQLDEYTNKQEQYVVDELREYVTNNSGVGSKSANNDNCGITAAQDDHVDMVYDDANEDLNDHQISNEAQTTGMTANEASDITAQQMQPDGAFGNTLPAPGPLIADTTEGLAVQLHEEVERHEMAGAVMEEEYANEYRPHYYH